jgi:hypothetical protein
MPDLAPEIAELLARVDELDAFDLDARIRRAVALEQRFEACAGPLLLAAVEGRLDRDRGYAALEGYARDTLGVSPRKARALLRLERACAKAPGRGPARDLPLRRRARSADAGGWRLPRDFTRAASA